jgi:adenylate kinase family enzyme
MHLVLDGTPRSLPEARVLTSAMDFFEREEPKVIYINVSRPWSEEKLLARGRADDRTLEKINKRLDWFDKDVVPAVEFFRTNPQYKFIEVNGEQTIEKVHSDIISSY